MVDHPHKFLKVFWDANGMLACVAGGIVSVREIRLSQASGEAAKPRGEWGEGRHTASYAG